jgi:hypothetical protein
LQPGFWRTSNSSLTLVPCRRRGVCVGGGVAAAVGIVNKDGTVQTESGCAPDRYGPLCEVGAAASTSAALL